MRRNTVSWTSFTDPIAPPALLVTRKKVMKEEDSAVPVEKCDEAATVHHSETPEKKGFMEKIKDKLPGQHKKDEEVTTPPPAAAAPTENDHHEGETKEKKGFLEKIKEKIPGYHSKTEDEKEKETTAPH
uniref:Dehydrin n=1 Tax=Gossypium raimondii TaxID=29730 RepID=A0A0D2NLT9_GOSRA|nr:hypothetical protein B456_002G119600 [Gossypium raimondii]